MDEVIRGLWIGDLPSALDVGNLKANGIYSILSAMRGRVTINETFIRRQIMLDDTDDADVLIHFLPSIAFIEAELDKGRGVLVHCQAGMSRSATIVAAFLMYTRNLDASDALELIRKVRPSIQPNDGFLMQLEIFHQASYKISHRNKATRMFYLERAVEEVMNGDGSLPETNMFAKYPRTPSDSMPNTPGGPRRRIRCKMCRQELATREHMLDHGQLGPATPAISFSPVSSRRPSMIVNDQKSGSVSRRPSNVQGSRRPSANQPRSRLSSGNEGRPRRPSLLSFGNALLGRGLSDTLSMSALETEDDALDDSEEEEDESPPQSAVSEPMKKPRSRVNSDSETVSSPLSIERAMLLGRRLSNTLTGSASNSPACSKDQIDEKDAQEDIIPPPAVSETTSGGQTGPAVTHILPPAPQSAFASPADLAAQLANHPKLAALRSPAPMAMTPLTAAQPLAKPVLPMSPPILANPKCSGYFVEPMKWMEPFLENGQLAGKIMCPNPKCGAKLGNYDWAGVCCSCREWVTPGFCIHRSKVDEFV